MLRQGSDRRRPAKSIPTYANWKLQGTNTPIVTPAGWEVYVTAPYSQMPLCGSKPLNAASAGVRRSIADCAKTCSSTTKCAFFTYFDDKGCLLFQHCPKTGKTHSWGARSKNFKRKPVLQPLDPTSSVYVSSSPVPLTKASSTTATTVEQKLDKLIKMQAMKLWLEDGIWDESFRQTGRRRKYRGGVKGTMVKFNGYACQAFGPDGPAYPLQPYRSYNSRHVNGGESSLHNKAKFTLPAGMFVPSASMPGLEHLNTMLGRFPWDTSALVVASSTANDYNYVATRGADEHAVGSQIKQVHGSTNLRGTVRGTNINAEHTSKRLTKPVIHQSGRQYKLNDPTVRLLACGRTIPRGG